MEIPTGANQKLDNALTIYKLSTDPLLSSTDSLLTLLTAWNIQSYKCDGLDWMDWMDWITDCYCC